MDSLYDFEGDKLKNILGRVQPNHDLTKIPTKNKSFVFALGIIFKPPTPSDSNPRQTEGLPLQKKAA